MKKLTAVLICIIFALSLAACGNAPAVDPVPESDPPASAPESTGEDLPAPPTPDTGNETEPADDGSVTVINNEYCVVKVLGIDDDSLWGMGAQVYCENKTDESTLRFEVVGGSVNGVEAEPSFSCEVAPQKNKTDIVNLTVPDELSGAEDYTDIEMVFRVKDRDSIISTPMEEKAVHVYPLGKDKASVYERPSGKNDRVMVDNDAISVTVTGFSNDSLYDCIVNLYIVNKTDSDLVFSAEDVSVNGLPCDPLFSVTVRAGKRAFSSIGWLHSTLWEQRIRSVEKVDLTLKAVPRDGESGTVIEDSVLHITLPGT